MFGRIPFRYFIETSSALCNRHFDELHYVSGILMNATLFNVVAPHTKLSITGKTRMKIFDDFLPHSKLKVCKCHKKSHAS
jgi:hypothetical protein